MFLSLFLFFLLFGLTSINFLVFASIKFDSFPFHMSFCSFFHTCTISLVEAIALWTWKATSGMSYPRSETVFFFCFLSFSEDHHIFCCPCGLILLFSSFGFSLAFVSSRTVKIKWNQTQQQQEIGVGVRYWTRLTSIYLSDPLRITSGMSFATFKA